ncbi:MAG: DEAD/DEAH box helicase [Ignavibacteriae bacterium]|nr:DEAD/DEAH box helicase [Ignavibacteriota bacterium]
MWSIINKKDYNTYFNTYYSTFNELDNNFILKENDKFFFLPRRFFYNYPHETLKLIKDDKFISKPINLSFTSSLRKEQNGLMEVIKREFAANGIINGIIKARPGFGKTVCSAYIAAEIIKKKTLIILDNTKLAEQWKSAFLEFTNISEENIGIIKGSKFNAKDITITMVQTLLSKIKNDDTEFYDNIRNEGFGLVIFDETHKTSAATKFATSSLLLNTENILGLSATPFGDDLHQLFMKNIIGDIIYESESYDLKPNVYFVHYKSGLSNMYFNRLTQTNDYIKQMAFYNSIIYKSSKYLEVISIISKKVLDSNRKGIIIVQTIRQLEYIIEYLKNKNITAVPLMSEKQDIDKEKDNLIVATYKMASHGFDFAELSCLILASPLKGQISLIQTIGRILRLYENKKQPLVFDLIDIDFDNIFSRNIERKKSIIQREFGNCDFTIINV